jgi:hypothetical protein
MEFVVGFYGKVKKGRRAVLFPLKGGGDGVYNVMTLLDSGVLRPKS